MSEVRRCQYIKADGAQCPSPALRDHNECYFHHNWRERELRRIRDLELQPPLVPDPMDENALQGALTEILRLMLMDEIDNHRAGLLLYALQNAGNSLDQLWYSDTPADTERAANPK